jgi:hypothetical protein
MNGSDSIFNQFFRSVEDPRLNRQKRDSLLDIIGIDFCAAIAGAESWTEIADFGRAKEDWLRTFLKLPNGIPSHDTFGRVFCLLDPGQFQEAFQNGSPLYKDKSAAWWPSTARRREAPTITPTESKPFMSSAPGPMTARSHWGS